ncbi:MAG: hypothetical protein ACXVH1_04925 [Solirubrobacteraceae bacterium]
MRIDRLVLNGVDLSRRERDALGPAIGRELARLVSLSPSGDPTAARHRAARSRVDGVARNIAVEVHRAIAPATASSRARR